MIAEWLQHLLTPCPRHLKRMGYLKELIAIRARHDRCQEAWAPHLEACQAAIGEAMRVCPGRGKVAVLGSGLLLDVSLAELAGAFDEVVLVDLVHLPAVKRAVRSYPNVRLVAADVTGCVEAVYRGALPMPEGAPLPEGDADLVISLNILTQLPLRPATWAARWHPPEAVAAFSRSLIADHLARLRSCPGAVCLIAESDRMVCDGEVMRESEDSLHGVALPVALQDWAWDIAPRPEADPDYDLRFRVRAVVSEKGLPPA